MLLLAMACFRAPPTAASLERVVVVVLDGVRLEESLGAGTTTVSGTATDDVWPRVRRTLLPSAAVVLPLHNPGITITAPAHCNLATGARVPMGNFVATGGLGYYLPEIPTIFEAVAAGGGNGAVIANTDLVQVMAYSVAPDGGVGARIVEVTEEGSDRPSIEDVPVLDAILAELDARETRLVIANLHAADRAGHEGEDGEYERRALDYDGALVDFAEHLPEGTLLVVTADHGRHNFASEEEVWRNHGDGCSGCRTVPLLVYGPGVAPGVYTTAYSFDDLTATVAAALGVSLPYGEGRVMTDVLPGLAPAGQVGEDLVSAAGEVTAVRSWSDGRSSVVVAGPEGTLDAEVLSSPDATYAEAVQVAVDGDVTYACWRELTLSATADAPWLPRCARHDGAWTDLGFPMIEVGPVWEPAMAIAADGALEVAVLTSVSMAVSDDGGIRLYRWNGDWSAAEGGADYVNFATSTALAPGDPTHVAFANSDAGAEDGRFTRHVEVRAVGDWTSVYNGADGVDADGVDWERRERPALEQVGDTLHLAMIGVGAAGSTVLTTSATVGATGGAYDWAPLVSVDPEGRVLPHLTPDFAGGVLVYARSSTDGEVEVCTWAGEAQCAATGATAIRGLSATTTGTWASLLIDGTWTTKRL